MTNRVQSTMNIHSCSYYCDRPECIKEQRDTLVKQKFVPLTDQEIIEAIKHISHNEMSAFAIARAIEKFRFGT